MIKCIAPGYVFILNFLFILQWLQHRLSQLIQILLVSNDVWIN